MTINAAITTIMGAIVTMVLYAIPARFVVNVFFP